MDLSGQQQNPRTGLRVDPEEPDEVHTFYVGNSCAERMLLYHGLFYFRARLVAGETRGAGRGAQHESHWSCCSLAPAVPSWPQLCARSSSGG